MEDERKRQTDRQTINFRSYHDINAENGVITTEDERESEIEMERLNSDTVKCRSYHDIIFLCSSTH